MAFDSEETGSSSALTPTQIKRLLSWILQSPELTACMKTHSNLSPRDDLSLSAKKFTHGQSNPTYLIQLRAATRSSYSHTKPLPETQIWPNSFRFVVRSKPSGKLLPGAHRIDREYKVLRALQHTSIPVPTPYAYCDDAFILGSPFYVMEFMEGKIFQDASLRLVQGERQRAQIYNEAIRVLRELRRVDPAKVGLSGLSKPTPPWIHRQIETWYKQYRSSRLPNVDYSSVEGLHTELQSEGKRFLLHADPITQVERSLVHGDFRLDNLVFRLDANGQYRCAAILDWELTSLGNPMADLASFLIPFHMPPEASRLSILQASVLLRPLPPGIPAEEELLSAYEDGDIPSPMGAQLRMYLAVALFKFAAILCGVQCRARGGNASSLIADEVGEQAHLFAKAGMAVLKDYGNHKPKEENGAKRLLSDCSLLEEVRQFMKDKVFPLERAFFEHARSQSRWTTWAPLEDLKKTAKQNGLWNFFLPKNLGGQLCSSEYAPLAEEMGKCVFGAEVFNCSAPDTGNMELLARYGTPAQKSRWLRPLLEGDIRSCFAMTEPAVASSDALNLATTIELDGHNYVINGRKWWTSGAMDPRCAVLLVLGRGPVRPSETAKHRQHSIVLVPMSSRGVHVLRHLNVFGFDDAPHGHAEISLTNVRVEAKEGMLHTEGGGFEAAQSRLGGGRIHHCMRAVGAAERAQQLMLDRVAKRKTQGKELIDNDAVKQAIGTNRCDIEAARSIVLAAAAAVDQGDQGRMRQMIGVAKVTIPRLVCGVIDRAIQAHGAMGVSQDTVLSMMYAHIRSLRLADGPDESHLLNLARREVNSSRRGARM